MSTIQDVRDRFNNPTIYVMYCDGWHVRVPCGDYPEDDECISEPFPFAGRPHPTLTEQEAIDAAMLVPLDDHRVANKETE